MVLDELGYLPFSQSGGALLFHLLSKLYERTSFCLLYTSDAADERSSVDLGGRRIIKKKKIRRYLSTATDSDQ